MRTQIIISMIFLTFNACSQRHIPANSFELFKGTSLSDLAEAVEKENKNEIINGLKNKEVNINIQEPFFGQTLLHLSIENNKLISTAILLENHADINILDSAKYKAIHEATTDIKSKNNSYEIIKLLIKYGANVNDTSVNPNINDTIGYYTPLMGAVSDLKCAKLLLENGANPYIKIGNTYPIWLKMATMSFSDYIFVAHYMIVEKRMLVPNPLSFNINKEPLTIVPLLKELDFSKDKKKETARKEILEYLTKINFPKNGVYSK